MRHWRAWMASVGAKVFATIFAVTAVIVTFLTIYFPQRHVDSARVALESKAETYVRLVGRELEPAVAFGDKETPREVFEAMGVDPDLQAAALYDSRGRLLYVRGELAAPFAPSAGSSVASVSVPGAIRCVAAVVSKEGPRGTLVIELSTARLDEQRASIVRIAAAVGGLALVAGAIAALLIGRSLGRRLRKLADAATAVAAGDLSSPALDASSRDEIGQLAGAFDGMVRNIKGLMDHIEATAAAEKTRLDALVKRRTAELDARNASMRLLLDNIDQGFFMLDREGVMSAERSRVVDTWLGAPPPNATLLEQARAMDARFSDWLAVGWDSVFDDAWPLELAIEQLPKVLRSGPRHFRVAYTPIYEAERVSRVLVVITDVTSEIERERSENEQRELFSAFSRMVRDRRGFAVFVDEATSLVSAICAGDERSPSDEKRAIHTLKGASSTFGLGSVARACDAVEQEMEERGGRASAEDRTRIARVWSAASAPLTELLRGATRGTIEIERHDLDRIVAAIREGVTASELVRRILALAHEPVATCLGRTADQARTLAERLGKARLNTIVDASEARLDPARWAHFWTSFTHAVRNGVHHGIEAPEERAAAGKKESGTLTLRARSEHGAFIVEIADDGRGIDWSRVRDRAHTLGVPSATDAELVEALFHDGLSTKDEITEISGRGVGLGALRDACHALDGRVSVTTAVGRGTTFQFRFPASVLETTTLDPKLVLRKTSSQTSMPAVEAAYRGMQ